MPQIAVNSSNITSAGFSLNVDVLNRLFIFNLLPFTTGPNLSVTKVSFFIQDQDGVQLANIDFTNSSNYVNPGTTTTWTLNLSGVVNFPFLFQTYQVYISIQDAGGQVYSTIPIFPNICQPVSLTDQGYVSGMFVLDPDCINNVLTVSEITALVYNGLQPQSVTKTGTLNYPTGTLAALSFSTTAFNVTPVYTGTYSIQCTTVATYAIGGDVYVLVSYVTGSNGPQSFPVVCNNKMSQILCCIQKVQQTAIRECNNAIGANAKQQMADISMFVLNGFLKQSSGQDAQFEVDYIKKYLGCDCGSSSLSQSEFTPINPAVTSIVLQGQGDTTIPSPTPTGNTLTYKIASNVYQIVKGDTGDLAFTIAINTAISNTVQYIVTFNYDTMAAYNLTAIANDPTLLAQLNSLITAAGSIIGLNGLCVINTSEVNYSLSQSFTGSTLLVNVVINGNTYAAPVNLFANNPTAVATWLNSLTLGTFSAAVNSGVLTILSVNNTNTPATLTFSSPNVTQAFQATNVTLVQVLQAIINYLCNLTDLQIALANNLAICTLDYNNNVVTTTYVSGTKQSAYNAAISNAICNICARINSLVAFTCAKLQALFSDNPNAQFSYASDRFLSVVGGACTTLTSSQAAMAFINAVNANPTVKQAFCAIDCTAPGTCPGISNVNFSSTSTSTIGFYGVTFAPVPSANQLVTLQYRVHGTTTWITANSGINLFPNGNINGTTPYLITGLTPGVTYDVSVGNNCGGTPFVSQVTVQPGGVLSGNYLLDNVIYAICADSPVILYSNVPFATGTTMYTNSSLTTPVTGYTLIANTLTGAIYNINSTTGVVGTATGSNCTSGTAGTYILGNNSGTICSGSTQTLYTNGAFGVGQVLYYDSALSTPVTGYSYVVQSVSSEIFNLNSSTGVVGSYTGLSCTGNTVLITSDMVGSQVSAVSGIVGFVNTGGSFPINPGGEVTGTHGAFTGNISITITGTPSVSPSSVGLTKNSVLIQCINITAAGTYTFPSESYLATDQIAVFANGSSC
jgi:hypothetical protein